MPKRVTKIKFEEIFEPTLRTEIENFLNSGSPSAYLVQALLISAALGAVIFAGAVAPNIFSAIGKFSGKSRKISPRGFYRLRLAMYRLKKQGLIEYIGLKDGADCYKVNKQGEVAIRKFAFDNLIIPKPDTWDRKWRVISFDIPHRHKRARDALRRKLQELNFFQLHKSVWVHPFPCFNEIQYVADVFKVGPYIETLTAEDLKNLKALKHFKEELSDTVLI